MIPYLTRLVIRESQRRHLWQAHQVRAREVHEALFEDPASRGYRVPDPERRSDSRLYQLFGQTQDGRLLMVLLRVFRDGSAYLVTARDMTAHEVRRRYRR